METYSRQTVYCTVHGDVSHHLNVIIQMNATEQYLPVVLGEEVLGSIFAGYVPLASHSPYPTIVYSVANYRHHLSHFCGNVNFAIPT